MQACVDRVVVDRWAGLMCNEYALNCSSFEQIVDLINALDATTETIICMYARNGENLTIGGGDGRYVTYMSGPDEQLWTLLSDGDGSAVVRLNIGGQIGEYSTFQVVDKTTVVRAARFFFMAGSADPDLIWEKQE